MYIGIEYYKAWGAKSQGKVCLLFSSSSSSSLPSSSHHVYKVKQKEMSQEGGCLGSMEHNKV